MTATTLSAAVAKAATIIQVASATGITALGDYNQVRTQLLVDNERMDVRSISGTNITVERGASGTPIQAHLSGSPVLILLPGETPVLRDAGVNALLPLSMTAVTTLNTVGNLTLTAQQILGGLILRDPNGGARTDTLPTATLLHAALAALLGDVAIGTAFEFIIRNTADAAETITVASGTDGTDSGTMTIAQSNSKRFLVRMTAVGSSPTYTCYSLGTVVH